LPIIANIIYNKSSLIVKYSMKIKIAPSLLAANPLRLEEEIKSVQQADMLHIDVMDGNFVPNITMGSELVKKIRRITSLPLDCHLMVRNPHDHIKKFAEAGADIITFHIESTYHADRLIDEIKGHGLKCGVALCPATSPIVIDYLYDKIDLILIMTVNPGAGGQNFIPAQLEKIRLVRDKIIVSGRPIMLQVDGGINLHTAKQVFCSGADVLVAGSFLFNDGTPEANIAKLRNAEKYMCN
jgi:ribulose-phosphate 3-epimerase